MLDHRWLTKYSIFLTDIYTYIGKGLSTYKIQNMHIWDLTFMNSKCNNFRCWTCFTPQQYSLSRNAKNVSSLISGIVIILIVVYFRSTLSEQSSHKHHCKKGIPIPMSLWCNVNSIAMPRWNIVVVVVFKSHILIFSAYRL